ncbi:MAG: radical SAM protein [Pirellulaceae bacterium]
MSGLRAHDPELLKLGLTLPGVIERGEVVTSMPSLGLLWLAAVTPDRHEVAYYEAQDSSHVPDAVIDCDIVAISALTAQAFEAYRVAKQLRELGITVVMGGLHATVVPEEVERHVDAVFVGEAERTWPLALADFENGKLKRRYSGRELGPVDISSLPSPRYDLLAGGEWNRFPLQTTRGCPWRCDFCASSIMLDLPYRKRTPQAVERDLQVIKSVAKRPFIELADDNTFVDHKWGLVLCDVLKSERVQWFTETDISVADDETLMKRLRESRCRQLLIGLEGTSPDELNGLELRANFKQRRAGDYMNAVRRIQDHGVTVNGCFVLGLDHQSPDIFARIHDFVMNAPLFEVQITVMTPFPGTPLYSRLLKEKRILIPGNWDLCTLFDVNFVPAQMTVDELRSGYYSLVEKLYSSENISHRRRAFLERLWQLHA